MYFKSQVDFAINYGQWDPNVRLLSGNYELYHMAWEPFPTILPPVSDTSARPGTVYIYICRGNYGEMV